MNASSGGLDIVAKIMNRFLRMDLGRAMSVSGMVVALSSALVYDKKTVVEDPDAFVTVYTVNEIIYKTKAKAHSWK